MSLDSRPRSCSSSCGLLPAEQRRGFIKLFEASENVRKSTLAKCSLLWIIRNHHKISGIEGLQYSFSNLLSLILSWEHEEKVNNKVPVC